MVNVNYFLENGVLFIKYYSRLEETHSLGVVLFTEEGQRSGNELCIEMDKLIRETELLLVYKSQRRFLISGYPSIIK